MKSFRTVVAGSLFVAGAVLGNVQAQAPGGQHPSYLVVLSDLRSAYGLLDYPTKKQGVDEAQGAAKSEIEQAIDVVKRAAVDDHKPLDSHPPVDTRFKDVDRFQKAQELLQQAHHDIDAADEIRESRTLKSDAIAHINAAWKSTGRAYELARR